jgi:translocator protein
MVYRLILFLLLNFSALAIGGFFTGKGVPSSWYLELIKAPWEPPGWVFGAAWSTIMICFSIYMSFLWDISKNRKKIMVLFGLQWVLNVGWSPAFFYFRNVILGMLIISTLTLLIGYLMYNFRHDLKSKSILLLPYLIWLVIATSLNGYILFNN